MAGSKSNYLENLVVNTVLGKSADLTAAIPSTLYLVLLNSTINDAWQPTDTGECQGANYARLAVTNSTANWTKASTGVVRNKTVLTFTTAASTGWGQIKAFAIVDTTSTGSGNSLYQGDLTAPATVSAGNVVQFSTGTIVVGEL